MRRALKEIVVPELRARGFRGSLPHMYRIQPNRIDLLSFQFSQFGPDLYIEVGSCPPSGAPAEIGKVRIHHAGLFRRRIGPQPSLDFGGISQSGGDRLLASQVLRAISLQGESWWEAPKSAVAI
jgi:hypothetical protein